MKRENRGEIMKKLNDKGRTSWKDVIAWILLTLAIVLLIVWFTKGS